MKNRYFAMFVASLVWVALLTVPEHAITQITVGPRTYSPAQFAIDSAAAPAAVTATVVNTNAVTGSDAIIFTAGGSDKDITLTPSGTGQTKSAKSIRMTDANGELIGWLSKLDQYGVGVGNPGVTPGTHGIIYWAGGPQINAPTTGQLKITADVLVISAAINAGGTTYFPHDVAGTLTWTTTP